MLGFTLFESEVTASDEESLVIRDWKCNTSRKTHSLTLYYIRLLGKDRHFTKTCIMSFPGVQPRSFYLDCGKSQFVKRHSRALKHRRLMTSQGFLEIKWTLLLALFHILVIYYAAYSNTEKGTTYVNGFLFLFLLFFAIKASAFFLLTSKLNLY